MKLKTKESKMKLSQWHDGSVKPVYNGVYEVRNKFGEPFVGYGPSYAFFSIKTGWTTATEFSYAVKKYIGACPLQEKQWRGIVKDKI